MGVGTDRTELALVEAPIPQRLDLDAEILAAEATATRPDLLAAHPAVAAASQRERLSRVSWVRLLGILDATSGTATGHELGPAFRVTLPVFNSNEGGVARARAELERAVRQRETVRQQIILDVHDAHL